MSGLADGLRLTAAFSAAAGVLAGAVLWRWWGRRAHRASGRNAQDGPPPEGPVI